MDRVQVVVDHRRRQWLAVDRQAFQSVLDGVRQKDPNSPCLISRVDGVQVVVCHIVLLVVLVAEEAHLSDPRLSSGQQVAVVTPLVAEVGHAEVVVDPSVAVVVRAEVVWNKYCIAAGKCEASRDEFCARMHGKRPCGKVNGKMPFGRGTIL